MNGRRITAPAFMEYQGEGKPLKPFARLNLKRDFHKISTPNANWKKGRRVFVSPIRKLSIRSERERGISVISPKGKKCTIKIEIGNDLKMQVKVEGIRGYRKVTVLLHPDSELFARNPIIEKSAKPGKDGSTGTITFTTAQVRECELIEVYIKRF